MYRLYRLLLIVVLTLVASPAFGQYTRDTAAKKKIDEAINKYYVETDFEKAEGVLLGTINACADKCSPQVHGTAWMYVGIVRGSGKNNQAGAKEAFQKAVAADPQVKLDMVLATPETQATFAGVSGGGAAAAPVDTPAAPEVAAAPIAAEGGLACSPEVREVETRRPIPIQCQSDEEVTGMEIKYKPFGSDTWKTLPMSKKGEAYRGTIPCDGTGIAGTLRVYVRAKDAQGEQVDSWGTKQAPIEFNLAEGVTAEPPAFEGEAPPARCQDKGECPPDFPGCSDSKSSDGCEGRGQKDWGAACDNSVECKCGLLCTDGTCETAPSCETDADCSTGTCRAGKCDIEGSGGFGPKEPFKKNWFGIHFAQDFAFVGGNNVCDSTLGQADDNYACFYEGTDDQPFFRTPFPYRDGIQGGMVLATSRIMLSYERAFTNRITLGARLGYAFGGGPPAGQTASVAAEPPANGTYDDSPWQVPANNVATGGTAFLPAHVEIRGTFWFLPLNAKLFRAYGALGGGMAQVDAKVSIPELDCNDSGVNYLPGVTPDGVQSNPVYTDPATGQQYSAFAQCQNGPPYGYYDYTKYPTYNVDGWKKMGQGFVTAAVGGMIAFKDNMGILINANFMYMLPASGIVIEPSLGFTIGM